MAMLRKAMPAQVNTLGDDEVEVVVSTGQRARDGHIFDPKGCDLSNYLSNPIVLWQHDPEHPVGRAEKIQIASDKITARVKFAPAGISHKADEIRGLVKSGVVSGVSVGIEPIESDPIDPRNPRDGLRVRSWELLEFSFCSIPVDTQALVTARSEGPTRAASARAMTTGERLRKAVAHHDRALEKMQSVADRHDKMATAIDRLDELRAAARAAVKDGNADRAIRHLSAINDTLTSLAEHHGEAVDAHRVAHRAIGHAATHVRAVLDGSGGKESAASHTVQTSAGVGEDHGTSPAERRLIAAAAEYGVTLSRANINTLVREARSLGRDADYHYRWLVANGRMVYRA